MNEMTKLTAKDFATDQEVRWCPGCGDYAVLKAVQRTMPELGVRPERAVVLEDAAAGVQAAKAGEMGAIGIARADDAELLGDAGADVVVTTLDDLDLAALGAGRLVLRA